jgi:hypothetical protein
VAALSRLNADRCRTLARQEGISLAEAADRLIEAGWLHYRDRALAAHAISRNAPLAPQAVIKEMQVK